MKKLVWVFGLLLLLSFVLPHLPAVSRPAVPENNGPTDETIVKILSKADGADKARVVGIYTGLKRVLSRDMVRRTNRRITTTEKWAELQANTLEDSVDQVGKYPGLDEAIEAVFKQAVGTDDVVPGNPDVLQKLSDACEIIINSASK